MRRRPRPKRPTRTGGSDGSLLLKAAVPLFVVGLVLLAGPSSLFTSISLPRESTSDVVTDPNAVIGIENTQVGTGTTRTMSTLTNQFRQSTSLTIRLTGSSADHATLYVGEVDHGDSATLNSIPTGGNESVSAAVKCRDSLVGGSLTYEIDASGPGINGSIQDRSVSIHRYCLTWYTDNDWDNGSVNQGVVHANYGDHDAEDLEPGYATSDTGLVAYWPFDEDSGSTANDVVGGHDGSLIGPPTIGSTGVLGTTGYDFDGGNDYVTVPNDPALEMNNTNEVTVSMWVNKDTAQSGWIALLQHSDQSYNLQFNNGNEPAFTIYDGGWNTAYSGTPLTNGEWYHVAGTFDGSTLTIYLNGVPQGTSNAAYISDGGSFDIGIGENLDATGRRFDGTIDEVRVYNRSLSPTEIERLAEGSSPNDTTAEWNGTYTTGWESADNSLTAANLTLSDVVSEVSGGSVTVSVESDTDNDGIPEETSDPIFLNGSTGPYTVSGLSTDNDRFRLRVELNTSSITTAPCFSGATLSPGDGLNVGSRSGCSQTNVTANQDPTAGYSYSPASPNTTDTVAFDASSSSDPDGTIATYKWDWNGDGTYENSTTNATVEHVFSSPGDYNVTLQVVDDDSATDSASQTVTVTVSSAPPKPRFSYAPTNPDPGVQVAFDASNSSDPDGTVVTYRWDWDDDGTFENVTSSSTIDHTFAGPGTHNVTLEVVDNASATNTTSQSIVVGTQSPTANFTYSPDSPSPSDTITFDASNSSDPDGTVSTFKWDWDDDGNFEDTTSSATINHNFATAGNYSVTLQVVDNESATDNITKTVSVATQPPTADFTYSPIFPDPGESITFDASASSDPDGSIAYYEWDWDGDGVYETNTTNPTTNHNFANGIYNVTLRVTDNDGATNSTNKTVTIIVEYIDEYNDQDGGNDTIPPGGGAIGDVFNFPDMQQDDDVTGTWEDRYVNLGFFDFYLQLNAGGVIRNINPNASNYRYEIDYRLPTSGSHSADVTIVASNGTALQTFTLTHQGATTTQENYTLNNAATTYLKNNGELYFTIQNAGDDGLVVTTDFIRVRATDNNP